MYIKKGITASGKEIWIAFARSLALSAATSASALLRENYFVSHGSAFLFCCLILHNAIHCCSLCKLCVSVVKIVNFTAQAPNAYGTNLIKNL